MELLNIIAVLITLSALFSYINYRFIKLPQSIGLMVIAITMSMLVVAGGWLGVESVAYARNFVANIDFNQTLMQGMLSFLLFAGALHVNLNDLKAQKGPVLALATGGVIISTFLIGTAVWWVISLVGLSLPYIYCLLFGALISPTDPIAVMGILKTVGAPKSLEMKIVGESLGNDGIGVVIFIVLLGIAEGGGHISAGHITLLFLEEAVGGVLFGFIIGYIAYRLLRSIDQYQVEVLISIAVVTGGYALAGVIHVSGPLAMVVAGLLIGNHGRAFAMSDLTRDHLDSWWHLLDEILNAILFVLIGLELFVIRLDPAYLMAAVVVIPIVLLSRFFSVGLLVGMMRPFRTFSPGAVRILTWGGLRGGISVALALSLPSGVERDLILTMTYVVVVFSILGQGLTVERLIRKSSVVVESKGRG